MLAQPDQFIAWFETLGKADVARVGGKNASPGEMVPRPTGRAGAGRLRDHRRGVPRVRRGERHRRRARRADASA